MTGTPFCLLPVTTLNSLKIGHGKVGDIYNKLLNAWCEEMKVDIKSQIIKWNKSMDNNISVSPYKFK